MRIISGTFKGRRIQAPKTLPVRPTTDMSKEALFNILNNQFDFSELKILDLFSGTGNISYEFASRGSKQIVSVDENFNCIKYINAVSKELDFNINSFKSDVYAFLEKTTLKADIIFADPPYHFETEKFLQIVDIVFDKEMIADEGLLIIEHSKNTDLSQHKNHSYDKRYGGNVFSFFEYNNEENYL